MFLQCCQIAVKWIEVHSAGLKCSPVKHIYGKLYDLITCCSFPGGGVSSVLLQALPVWPLCPQCRSPLLPIKAQQLCFSAPLPKTVGILTGYGQLPWLRMSLYIPPASGCFVPPPWASLCSSSFRSNQKATSEWLNPSKPSNVAMETNIDRRGSFEPSHATPLPGVC